MGTAKKRRHLTVQELADYLRPALSEEREGEVEAHLADCPVCAKRAEETQVVLAVMDRWTAREHSRALAPAEVSRALRQLEAGTGETALLRRLGEWRAQAGGRLAAACELVLPGEGRPPCVLSEPPKAGAGGGRQWEFCFAREAPERKPAARWRGRGLEAAAVGGRGRRPLARLSVDQSHSLHVRVEGLAVAQRPPLVLLVAYKSGVQPRVAELQQEPRPGCYAARFPQAEPGKYLVAFEPVASAAGR
jgi:hypothetical protein